MWLEHVLLYRGVALFAPFTGELFDIVGIPLLFAGPLVSHGLDSVQKRLQFFPFPRDPLLCLRIAPRLGCCILRAKRSWGRLRLSGAEPSVGMTSTSNVLVSGLAHAW